LSNQAEAVLFAALAWFDKIQESQTLPSVVDKLPIDDRPNLIII